MRISERQIALVLNDLVCSFQAASQYYVDAACCYRRTSVVCRLYVCLSVTIVSPAKTAEPIEMPFGIWTRVDLRKHVLDDGAHWRNLANTTEPSMCVGDAASLSNYFDLLFFLFPSLILGVLPAAPLVCVCA